jgi:hypothetical protein
MRATCLALVLILSGPGAALAADTLAAAGDADAASPPPLEASETAQQRPAAPTAAQRPAPPATPQLPPPLPERKRLGSFVGYIDDATIQSQIRVRFDAAWGNSRPDRNEFFYAQCGCNGPGKPGPQGLVTDLRFQQATIEGQYAVHDRIAVFAAVPFRMYQPQSFFAGSFGNEAGLSDVRAGIKGAFVSNDATLLTAQVQGYFQSGRASDGLGAGHASVEPALLLNQKLSERVSLESQIGDWHPIGGTDFNGVPYTDDVLFYGVGAGFEAYRSGGTSFAPVVEFVGWHLFGGLQVQPPTITGQAVVPADANIVNLKVGVRMNVDRNSFYIGYGRGLTDAVWYSDIVRFEYRYSF